MTTVLVEHARFFITPTFVDEMTRLLVECDTITHADGDVFARKIDGKLCFCESEHWFGGYPDVFDFSGIYGCDDGCPCEFAMDCGCSCICACDADSNC